MAKLVAVVAVHPDDETLGCGGAILKHIAAGDKVIWIIVTNISEEYGWKRDVVLKRQKEIEKVSKLYKFYKVYKLNVETKKVDIIPKGDLIGKFSEIFHYHHVTTVYLPNRSDVHSDHRVTFECAYAATKSFNYPSIKQVLMYECLSETEFSPALLENAFVPNYFIDISAHLRKKITIMKVFSSEIKKHPFPRNEKNIEALATFRGAQAGVEYAESFVLLKSVWK